MATDGAARQQAEGPSVGPRYLACSRGTTQHTPPEVLEKYVVLMQALLSSNSLRPRMDQPDVGGLRRGRGNDDDSELICSCSARSTVAYRWLYALGLAQAPSSKLPALLVHPPGGHSEGLLGADVGVALGCLAERSALVGAHGKGQQRHLELELQQSVSAQGSRHGWVGGWVRLRTGKRRCA